MVSLVILFVALFAGALGSPNVKYDSNLNWKVVGGEPATDGQFPFIVSIRRSNSHMCGGSILNSEWILTAAHCLVGQSASDLTIVAGSILLDKGGVTRKVSKIIHHEKYNQNLIQNDVGLMKLAEPLELNKNIAQIESETEDVAGGKAVTLVGWGRTSYPGSIPNNLQHVDLKTITVKDCQQRHSPNDVFDSQICTLTKRGEGACHGDSGGPLVGENGKQVGIVSWGQPCAIGYPDVFTRVSSFKDWIDLTIRAEGRVN